MWSDAAGAPAWENALRYLGQVAAVAYQVGLVAMMPIAFFLEKRPTVPLWGAVLLLMMPVAGISTLLLAWPLAVISDSPTLGWGMASLGVLPISLLVGVLVGVWREDRQSA
jgi:hypothetical protein